MKKRIDFLNVIIYLFFGIYVLTILIPVFWTVLTSFKEGTSMFSVSLTDFNFTLDHYKKLFLETEYLRWFMNTLKIAIINTIVGLFLTTLTAYIFSRYNFSMKRKIMMNMLILQMFPSFLSMTAIFILLVKMNLIDTYLGLILVYTGSRIPFDTWLVKGYFDALPKSLDEAAKTDGAGHLTIFTKIILPLAKPILVFVGLTGFIGPWLDFIFPTLILRSPEKKTLAMGIFEWITKNSGDEYTLFTAGAIIVAIPISIFFIVLQKYIAKGLVSGAVKE